MPNHKKTTEKSDDYFTLCYCLQLHLWVIRKARKIHACHSTLYGLSTFPERQHRGTNIPFNSEAETKTYVLNNNLT